MALERTHTTNRPPSAASSGVLRNHCGGYDTAKLARALRAGEYWVIDVTQERILAYLHPLHGIFQRTDEYSVNETISLQAFPNVKIAVRELFA
jgi:Uma2 family endonuclease